MPIIKEIQLNTSEECPRDPNPGNCSPISCILSYGEESFVCVGESTEESRSVKNDKFRHCFKNDDTDTLQDYDEYDLKSVMYVISEALLLDEMQKE